MNWSVSILWAIAGLVFISWWYRFIKVPPPPQPWIVRLVGVVGGVVGGWAFN